MWATIIPRDDWAGDLPANRQVPRIETPTSLLVAHHGASGPQTVGQARQDLKYHRSKWADYGYSFAVSEGRTLEGRGAGRQGAHARGHNHRSHGVCIPGDLTRADAEDRNLEELARLFADGVRQGWWRLELVGHQDLPGHEGNDCPARLHGALGEVKTEARRLLEGAGVFNATLVYANPVGSAWDWMAATKAAATGGIAVTGDVEVAREEARQGTRVVAVGPDARGKVDGAEELVGEDRFDTLDGVFDV